MLSFLLDPTWWWLEQAGLYIDITIWQEGDGRETGGKFWVSSWNIPAKNIRPNRFTACGPGQLYCIQHTCTLQYSQAYATYMYCTLLYRVQKVKSTVHKIHVPQYHILVLNCTSRETFCVRTWSYQSEVRFFSLIKLVLFQGSILLKSFNIFLILFNLFS